MAKVVGIILRGDQYNSQYRFVNNYLWVTLDQFNQIMASQDEGRIRRHWVDNRVFSVMDISIAQEVELSKLDGVNYPKAPQYLLDKITEEQSGEMRLDGSIYNSFLSISEGEVDGKDSSR